MDVLLGCIAPVNFPRLKVFWVVRFLSDGTYEAVEKHRTKASAEKSMYALEKDHTVVTRVKTKVGAL
jgi:hypothetical protein